MYFDDFSAQDGSENDAKLAQDHPKTVPKANIFHVEFLLQFWSVVGSVLAPFGEPFGLQDRSKIGPKIIQNRPKNIRKIRRKTTTNHEKIDEHRPKIIKN